jgi:methyl farnesoate epoxidase / farnesoate epoxidase
MKYFSADFEFFVSGKRRCMGENLAKSSLFQFFASFVHSYEFRVPDATALPSWEGIDGITLTPKPFQVILKPRF